MKQIPTNAPDGIAFTITTKCNETGATNLVSGGGHYPSTGVIVVTDDTEKQTPGGAYPQALEGAY